MNGVLVIDKEKNYTSRDIVNIVGKTLHTKKVGHTGTLDPLATGVLVICVGKATKLVELLTDHDKEYIADMTFGIETDTLDNTGKILKNEEKIISREEILAALQFYEKEYEQVVPLYSAVRIHGKKLYEYAREKEEVKLPSRKVKIEKIELLKYETIHNQTHIQIKCHVSKGTYIRSLIRDIASFLGTSAVMTDLRRTRVGNFTLNDAITLKELNENSKLLKIEEVLSYPIITVDGNLEFKIKNGCKIENTYKEQVVLFKNKNQVLGLYKDENRMLKPYKMFYEE